MKSRMGDHPSLQRAEGLPRGAECLAPFSSAEVEDAQALEGRALGCRYLMWISDHKISTSVTSHGIQSDIEVK